jgi:hypothetical protein
MVRMATGCLASIWGTPSSAAQRAMMTRSGSSAKPFSAQPCRRTTTELQAGAIVAYFHSIAAEASSRNSLPGDADRGKALFAGKG